MAAVLTFCLLNLYYANELTSQIRIKKSLGKIYDVRQW